MNRGGLYLAVYDISVDRERARLSAILEGYGVRVQKSAFELRLTHALRTRLLRELGGLNPASGWVALYRLEADSKRHIVGVLPPQPLAEEAHAYIL